MPTISVIVPVYNVEKYLNKCVDSILAQTFTDFELILINDGSTDDSGKICDEYANNDSRIVVIHQQNKGVSAARNLGIDLSKGKYLTFIDSDDYVRVDFFKNLFEKNCDLAVSGLESITDNGVTLGLDKHWNVIWKTKSEIDYFAIFKTRMMHNASAKLYKKTIIEENKITFAEAVTWGEDSMFVFEYIKHCDSIALLENIDYYYVRYGTDNTLSTKIRPDIMDMYTISREYCAKVSSELCPEKRNELHRIYKNIIIWLCIGTLQKTITSKSMSKSEKIELLKAFLNNKYVDAIIINPTKYLHPKDPFAIAFKMNAPKKIIRKYNYVIFKNTLINALYRAYIKVFRS